MLIVAAGVLIGLRPLHDNSFLTHLATGRLILGSGSVPSTDPYTFTAPAEPWVVQSWLPSLSYAFTEGAAGLLGLRAFFGLQAGVLAWLGWRLLRPIEGLVARLAVGALFIGVGSGLWAERPFMVGLCAFAVTMLAVERVVDARWLLPLGWLWVNSHGSFPLGIVYLVVVLAGARLDGKDWRHAWRCLRFAVVGALLGAVGPLGIRALTFPFALLRRQDVLRHVVEWQAPAFDSLGQRLFLVQLAIAIVLVARRPSYRSALVLAVFTLAALLGSRNLSLASLAMLAGMATSVGPVGSLRSSHRPRLSRAWLAGAGAASGLMVLGSLESPTVRLQAYPVDALAFIDERHVDLRTTHLAAPEYVGNLIAYTYGPGGRVFYDDRFDMFPGSVSKAALALTKAEPAVFTRLAELDIDLLLVPRDESMALVLTQTVSWRVLFSDEGWLLACRRGAELSESRFRC